MSKPKKRNTSIRQSKPQKHKRLRILIVGSLCVGLVLLLYVLYLRTRTVLVEPNTATVRTITPHEVQPINLLRQSIERAYAIGELFHQVYTPTWEGANGAIGDAHLFAATGDQQLLLFYTNTAKLIDLHSGTWVDDRAWICLAEMYWWNFTGRTNTEWLEDAKNRYLEARREGRLSHHEGFWSWYNWPPGASTRQKIFTNSNMNQMVATACWLYEATRDQQYYTDALLVWNGDDVSPGVENKFYRGNGVWKGNEGQAAFGKQFPWDGAGMCSIGAALYRMTGEVKYREIVVATARRIMDPANGWIDPKDFYQLRMDGNGAFVHFILDAYEIAPDQLSDIPEKIEKMLEHVWTNHHESASITLHRFTDDGIRNGWNPNGGEDGYHVNEVGTVHAQSQALRAFGVFAYVLHRQNSSEQK